MTISKQRRPRIVCDSCKRRKIKCDRLHPSCSQCVKSNLESSCSYTIQKDSNQNTSKAPYSASVKIPLRFVNRPRVCKTEYTQRAKKSQVGEQKGVFDAQTDKIIVDINNNNDTNKNFQFSEDDDSVIISRSELSRLQKLEADVLQNKTSTCDKEHSTNQDNNRNYNSGHHFPTNESSFCVDHPLNITKSSNQRTNAGIQPSTKVHLNYIILPPMNALLMLSDYLNTELSSGDQLYDKYCIGVNPYSHNGDLINFYNGYSPIHNKIKLRRLNFGPFAWSSLMKRDWGLSIIWDFILKRNAQLLNKDGTLVYPNLEPVMTGENNNFIINGHFNTLHPDVFRKRALISDGYDEIIPYNNILTTISKRDGKQNALSATNVFLGSTLYDAQINRELQLIEIIKVILPNKKVNWKLIERYFSTLYPFMPFLVEEYFIKDITRIIGPVSYEEDEVELNIENKLDLAIIGTHLIILRLSYLSLYNKIQDRKNYSLKEAVSEDDFYLLSYPMSLNTIDVANLCLNQFQLFKRTSFTVLQLGVYMRLYHTYAPEDGYGADGGDSQILNATLIQIATSLGMNRDPLNVGLLDNPKLHMLSRKIWYFLLMCDLDQAYTFGNPTTMKEIYFDTKLPFYEKGSENSNSSELDVMVEEFYSNFGKIYPVLNDILNLSLNIKGSVNIPHLCLKISELEINIYKYFGHVDACLTKTENQYNFQKNLRIEFYLSMKGLLVSIFFHLYWNYNKSDTNISYFYLKKIFLITTCEIIPNFIRFLHDPNNLCDMIITPRLETMTHKINQVLLSCIIRVNFKILNMKRTGEHNNESYCSQFEALVRFLKVLVKSSEILISVLSSISNRYYYAWRIAKQHDTILHAIRDDDMRFYKENYTIEDMLALPSYSITQLTELSELCEKAIILFEESSKTKNCEKQNKFIQPDNSVLKTHENKESLLHSSDDYDAESINKYFSIDFINDSDVDKFWYQMLSMKNINDQHKQEGTSDDNCYINGDSVNSLGNSQDELRPTNNNSDDFVDTPNCDFSLFTNRQFAFDNFDIFDDDPFKNISLKLQKN